MACKIVVATTSLHRSVKALYITVYLASGPATALLCPCMRQPLQQWLAVELTLLVVHCPCSYGLAWGDSNTGNPFLAEAGYAMKGWSSITTPSGGKGRWADWFFQWAFAATAATIPAGAVAERFNFNAYLGEFDQVPQVERVRWRGQDLWQLCCWKC